MYLWGIGEPLDNLDSVKRFLELINDSDGMNIGMRHVTLSTCGLVEKVDKLGLDNLQLTLSVSLHAPDDETRTRLMPINKAYGVEKTLRACANYFKSTGRRVSFEYAMINGVNDSKQHAQQLSEKLRHMGCPCQFNSTQSCGGKSFAAQHSRESKDFYEYT